MTETPRSHQIALIDDDTVVGRGVRHVLEHELGQPVQTLSFNRLKSDVKTLVDRPVRLLMVLIWEKGRQGVSLYERIRPHFGKIPVVVIGRRGDHTLLRHIRMSHAQGWLPHDCSSSELAEAMHKVIRGDVSFPSISVTQFLDESDRYDTAITPMLTDREFEIFSLLAEGLSVHDVAKRLFLSSKTVSNHRTNILNKLRLQNSAQLARLAIRHGVIEA